MPCAHCRAISSHNVEMKRGKTMIPYNCLDKYPNFPALQFSAEKGCAFCGLLRHALQDKYSDEKKVEAENDFDPSIHTDWPESGWNGQVTVDGALFLTEDTWYERDESQTSDQSLHGVYALSLQVWPYPPRLKVTRPEFNRNWIWFAVYANIGECATSMMISLLMVSRF